MAYIENKKNSWSQIVVRGMLLVILLLIIDIQAIAQSDTAMEKSPSITAPVEWEQANYRIPTENQIEKYQNDDRFKYGESFFLTDILAKLLAWLQDFYKRIASNTNSVAGIVKTLFYILAVVVLIATITYIVLRIKGVNLKSFFGKKKIDTPDINFYTEDVNVMDFETLIASAIKNKNYRLAIRFLYLKNLKELSDKHIIKWDITKTNISYQSEIRDVKLRSMFLEITFIFDYVWYGEFIVDAYQFEIIEGKMKDFNKMLVQ